MILQFFEEIDDHNVYLNYKVAKRLQELKQEMPMIDSIYLVRLHDHNGQQKMDSDWDAYLKGFEGLKLNRYLEIYQKSYDTKFGQ